MVTVVVVINLVIALILLGVAWLLWQLPKRLTQITNTLIAVERSTYTVLKGAPSAIYIGKSGINRLRQGRQPIQLKLLQVRQVLSLFYLGQRIWQQFSRRIPMMK